MKPYFSKVLIATLFSSAVEASTTQTYWADGVSESGGWTADLQHPNQCWGAVTGNTIGWWKKRVKTPITFKENTPSSSVEISKWIYDRYTNIQGGLHPYRGMEYFFTAFAPSVKLYEDQNNKTSYEAIRGPTKISGGPFWTERYEYNGELITKSLIENFKTGKVVAALTSETHTVTLWGIEVDEKTGRIKKGWISDSVEDKSGRLTMVPVTGNYDEKNNMFYFAYNYYVPNTGAFVLDAYYIHSITYVSIDEARNTGTYKDTSNREDCKLSLAPGTPIGYCEIGKTSASATETVTENSEGAIAVSVPETTVSELESNSSVAPETANAEEVKPAEPTEPIENASDATPTDSPETVVIENTPSTPASESSGEPSVGTTAQPVVETPVVVTEEAKPTEPVVAENNEKPTATSNTETTVSEENSSEITSTDSSASNAETVVLETENTPSTPANENSDEPSVDNTAQPAVETPVIATEDAKPTAEAVAETSEQPTAVPTPEVAEPAPEPTPSVASTETATVSEVKPTEPETAERLAVKSLKEAIANYQELSFVTTRVGDVTRYLIQREGIDIALIDPNSKQILVNNTGLVNYDLA
ncbi:hypothetical protein Q7473_11015, partial [Glaesserella parasuis]|nr:hypothetical protein [Glaesserella parasuis]